MSGPSDIFSMDKVVAYYGAYGIISSGKFLVSITGIGSKAQQVFSGKNIGFMAETFSIAPPYLGNSEYFNHGRMYPFLNDYKTSSGTLSFFDTGVEYGYFEKYMNVFFDSSTGLYSYPDDIAVNISVFEYTQMSTVKQKHRFAGCFFTEYGKKTLSHTGGELMKFDVTFFYKDYEWEAGEA